MLHVCVSVQELEKHTAAFVDQARLLSTWDSAVLSNRHALLGLEAELRAVHAGQEALDRQLGMIETHQKVRGRMRGGAAKTDGRCKGQTAAGALRVPATVVSRDGVGLTCA